MATLIPSLIWLEPFRAVMEFTFQQFATPHMAAPGDGHPVVIFPGLGADGSLVSILRAHCQGLGYEAFAGGGGSTPALRVTLKPGSKALRIRSAGNS